MRLSLVTSAQFFTRILYICGSCYVTFKNGFACCACGSGGSKGGARDTPPLWPKISSFSCSFREKLINNRLAPPSGVNAPSSGNSWIRHCVGHRIVGIRPEEGDPFLNSNFN